VCHLQSLRISAFTDDGDMARPGSENPAAAAAAAAAGGGAAAAAGAAAGDASSDTSERQQVSLDFVGDRFLFRMVSARVRLRACSECCTVLCTFVACSLSAPRRCHRTDSPLQLANGLQTTIDHRPLLRIALKPTLASTQSAHGPRAAPPPPPPPPPPALLHLRSLALTLALSRRCAT
jgi:hypothetical protein